MRTHSAMRRTLVGITIGVLALASVFVGVAAAGWSANPYTVYWCGDGAYGWLGGAKYIQTGKDPQYSWTSATTYTRYTPAGYSKCTAALQVGPGNISTWNELFEYGGPSCGFVARGNDYYASSVVANVYISDNYCDSYCLVGSSYHFVGLYGETRSSPYSKIHCE